MSAHSNVFLNVILHASYFPSRPRAFMSLRGHPKEAAAISPYLFAFTSTRDCFVATLLAMTYCPLLFCLMPLRGLLLPPVIASPPLADVAISPYPFVPTNPRRLLRHCVPRKDILDALPLHVVSRPSEEGRGNLPCLS